MGLLKMQIPGITYGPTASKALRMGLQGVRNSEPQALSPAVCPQQGTYSAVAHDLHAMERHPGDVEGTLADFLLLGDSFCPSLA